ncbi:hypothetical protein BC940DRAFT_335715 [Gongronella butleri]|nr:hypothetical protein BC940DRAFT_335715 [Gongronella butleri]
MESCRHAATASSEPSSSKGIGLAAPTPLFHACRHDQVPRPPPSAERPALARTYTMDNEEKAVTPTTTVSTSSTTQFSPVSTAVGSTSTLQKAARDVSPKKRVKRWLMACVMVTVGLLIALTFIFIGLGRAFQTQAAPASSSPSFSSNAGTTASSAIGTAAAATKPLPPSHATLTLTQTIHATHVTVTMTTTHV